MTPRVYALTLVSLLALPATARAHIELSEPKPRYEDLKYGPCGKGTPGDARSKRVTSYKPGATITVRWTETIGHPGHYRIAFDPDGQRFTDPSSFTDTAPRQYVLVDDIADKTGTQDYEQTITLPSTPTQNGTLQVIQVMTDKAPYGDGNDLYYQCADIVLDPAAPDGGMFVDGSQSSSSSASSSGSASSSSGATTRRADDTPKPAASDDGCRTSRGDGVAWGAALAFVLIATRRRR